MVKHTLNNRLASLIMLLPFLVLMSCSKNELITGDESVTPAFSEIILNSSFDVELTQDTTYSIRFEAAEEFFPSLKYEIIDSVLYVDADPSPRWRYPEAPKPKVYITSNRPKLVKAQETCNITSSNAIISDEFGLIMASKLNNADLELNCGVFYYWNNHPCGGRIHLRGRSQQLKIWNYAIMAVDASDCESAYVLVENYSKGNVRVWATDKFEYRLSGSGNIELKGNPTIISEIDAADGAGKLIRLN